MKRSKNIHWSFLEIKDRRIKKLAKEVIQKLSWVNMRTKTEAPYINFITECLDKILLRNAEAYKEELAGEIKEIEEVLPTAPCKDDLKKEKIILRKELKHLTKKIAEANVPLGYCIQTLFSKKGSTQYPRWKIVLFKESIKTEKLNDKKIRLLIGHEIAHAYIAYTVNYGHQQNYGIDDLILCNAVDQHIFKVV